MLYKQWSDSPKLSDSVLMPKLGQVSEGSYHVSYDIQKTDALGYLRHIAIVISNTFIYGSAFLEDWNHLLILHGYSMYAYYFKKPSFSCKNDISLCVFCSF